jgi:glutathione-regulated potassium-efflux system ancillary protein KefG
MQRILILFAHPRLEKSRINRRLLTAIPADLPITFHDLYEKYPDFNIDVRYEQDLLLANDVIIWHHPFYWYSCPALLKQWIDMVLEFGWAFGPGGTRLEGKKAMNVVTTGGAQEAYLHEGKNRFQLTEFLAPFNQTAHLCRMTYLPPFAVQGTHRLSDRSLEDAAEGFETMLRKVASGDYSYQTEY